MPNRENSFTTSEAEVYDYKDVKSILRGINWNFYQQSYTSSVLVPFDTRKHIAYPATYVPEIPFTLIEVLSRPGSSILDPFSGSGTTFFQALIQNRIPYGNDICKVSVEYIQSLLTLFDSNSAKTSSLEKIRKIITKYDSEKDYAKETQKHNRYAEELRNWYSISTFNMLCYLINEENRLNDDVTKAILRIALLSVLKNVCSQDRGWGCIADNMIPKKEQIKDKDVFKAIMQKSNLLVTDIDTRLTHTDKSYNKTYQRTLKKRSIFSGDIRQWTDLKNSSIDCIITSPPYPNMADYITSQRLNYYYLGSNPDLEKFNETGARFKRARGNSISSYVIDMMDITAKLSRVLKDKGYLCLVLPEFDTVNQRDSVRKNAIQSIIDNLEGQGFVKRDIFERILPSMRRAHNQKWATLKKEKIYIYQKHQV